MMRCWIMALMVCCLALPAWAINPDEVLADPVLEARARDITREVRCLVCQGESIDESNAQLAADLRIVVRQRLQAGDTDEEVKAYLVSRYGEYVLLKPRFSPRNAILWGAPVAILICGAAFALMRGRARRQAEAPLSAEEKAALDRILKTDS